MIIPIKPWLEMADGKPVAGGGIRPPRSPFDSVVLPSDPAGWELDRAREASSVGARAARRHEISKPTPQERMEFYHESIMGREVVDALRPGPGRQFLDGTLGGGGHAEMLLSLGAHVIGLDQDAAAIEHASGRLEEFGDRFLPVRGNFAELDEKLDEVGVDQVDGILLDLGVSSRQLDDGARGFSFREDAPLDMRMDQGAKPSAREIVNEWSEEELAKIFWDYGEEKKSRRVARRIVESRESNSLETTGQLAGLVEQAIPRTSGKHPATRVFQALRIAVNRELEVLEKGLEKAVGRLAPGGVLAVIAFHSLEDRIVKRFLRDRSRPTLDRPEWPEPRPNPDYVFDLPSRRPIAPDEEEVKRNPRSRSAKLRTAVRR